MRIAIISTPQITTVDGAECRVWRGVTEAGTECTVFVRRIAVRDGHHEEFARELDETAAPAELQAVTVIPLRNVL